MHIIFIRSYKKKLVLTGAFILVCVLALLITELFISHCLIFKVTINNYLSFSYPLNFEVGQIYINDQYETSIETNTAFRRPLQKTFNSFKSLNGKITFSYPSAFQLQEKDFTGSEVLYHIDFHNKANTTHGFVQVWNIPYPLEEFLNKSLSTSRQNYKYFNTKAIQVNGIPGFYWDYSITTKDGRQYKGSEAFLEKDSKIFRISYFVPDELWDKEESDTYWKIVNSFKTF